MRIHKKTALANADRRFYSALSLLLSYMPSKRGKPNEILGT